MSPVTSKEKRVPVVIGCAIRIDTALYGSTEGRARRTFVLTPGASRLLLPPPALRGTLTHQPSDKEVRSWNKISF
ncbi:hypothetical protein QM646_31955, partial [Rhodococcus erythropolis]|nr:hypothetical protein [Rhodococcus erythropolis]